MIYDYARCLRVVDSVNDKFIYGGVYYVRVYT